MQKRGITRRLIVAIAVLALSASACGDDDAIEPEAPAPTEAPTPTEVPTTLAPTTTASVTIPPSTTTAEVGVYFVATVLEPAAGGVVDALAASVRTVEVDDGATPAQVAEATLTAALAGVSALEAEIGFSSSIPPSTVVHGVVVDAGVATVDLSADFEAPGGAFTDTLRVAQVVFALTAVDGIDAVRFAIDGDVRDSIGSHGVAVDADDGVDRDDFPEARPPILVEQPTPGATIGDQLAVRGEANTFEANVRWALTDPDGEILEEDFTTATAGTGTWGTFEFVVTVPPVDRPGRGALILWEDSAEDGRQTNIVEVPLEYG